MALATALAIGATVAGSALASGKASSNANKAADAATANTAANNALTEKIYSKNEGYLAPSIASGQAAGALLNDFYGIPQATQTTSAFSGQTGPDYAGYVNANPDIQAEFQRVSNQFGGDPAAFGQFHYNTYGQGEGRNMPTFGQATTTSQAVSPSAKSAFANYIANSDYAFQQATGNNEVNSGFAGAGTVQSGAAMKALERYRQNLQSGYRNQWASGVANQQGVGLSAANALAGVSTNYANTIAASNTAAADARANAALSQQSTLGNALGSLGSGILKGFG